MSGSGRGHGGEEEKEEGKKKKRDGEEGTRVSGGDMTCLALRKPSKEGARRRAGEREMEGSGERPAMSSLTVHWAAHVSTLYPSSGSDSLSHTHRQTHTHTSTYRVLPNGLLHSPFTYNPRPPALQPQPGYISQGALAVATSAMTDGDIH